MSVTISGGGQIIKQVAQTVVTSVVSTSSPTIGSFTAVSGMSATITPTSASNKVMIIIDANMSISTSDNQGVMFQLFRNGSPIYIGDAASTRSRVTGVAMQNPATYSTPKVYCCYVDSPATTSAVTYSFGVCSTSAGVTVYLNRTTNDADANYSGRAASAITVMEVSGS